MNKNMTASDQKMTITYRYQDGLYINIGRKCSAACQFCIKYSWSWKYRSYDLAMPRDPTVAEIIEAVGDPSAYKEVVFCGYSEPFLRLEELKAVAKYLKSQNAKVRVNTTGHGNLIHKRNVVPELKGLIDVVSISLNAENAEKYDKIHKPWFGLATHPGMIEFAKECKTYLPRVILTAIDLPEGWKEGMPTVDLEKCRAIAESIGVEFRVRPYLDDYEES